MNAKTKFKIYCGTSIDESQLCGNEEHGYAYSWMEVGHFLKQYGDHAHTIIPASEEEGKL